jgi:hypothetical protein
MSSYCKGFDQRMRALEDILSLKILVKESGPFTEFKHSGTCYKRQ